MSKNFNERVLQQARRRLETEDTVSFVISKIDARTLAELNAAEITEQQWNEVIQTLTGLRRSKMN